ncbi:unnamed protein product [Schistocephalus solidus]|uniref:FABP domain-containing protein n=1 Tax=Schistocephalus solidus TaxID=70667 RepID=A0A183SWY0_SCHSO|nr:unnamed protein product [Schistocephalus solidus]
MENFLGSWLLEKNEKFTDFLHCLGVPYLVCKFANWLPTTINICQEADEYTIETVTTFKTTKARFKPDEPFEETSMGDTNLKVLTVEDVVCRRTYKRVDRSRRSAVNGRAQTMEQFLGSWLLEKNENLVEYLHCLGAPYLVSKFIDRQSVTVNIRQEADGYTIESVTPAATIRTRFKLGEPFEEPIMGDITAKVT